MLNLDRIEKGFLHRYADRIVTIDSHTQGPSGLSVRKLRAVRRSHG